MPLCFPFGHRSVMTPSPTCPWKAGPAFRLPARLQSHHYSQSSQPKARTYMTCTYEPCMNGWPMRPHAPSLLPAPSAECLLRQVDAGCCYTLWNAAARRAMPPTLAHPVLRPAATSAGALPPCPAPRFTCASWRLPHAPPGPPPPAPPGSRPGSQHPGHLGSPAAAAAAAATAMGHGQGTGHRHARHPWGQTLSELRKRERAASGVTNIGQPPPPDTLKKSLVLAYIILALMELPDEALVPTEGVATRQAPQQEESGRRGRAAGASGGGHTAIRRRQGEGAWSKHTWWPNHPALAC